MDSRLVVEQMSGRWQIKHPALRPLAAEAAALAGRFDTVRFTWVAREQNRRADALANAAMDGRPATDAEPAEGSALGTARGWMPPTGAATRLVLVRHGETALTAQRRYSGRGDVALSKRGLAQAEATAARLAVLCPGAAAIVTSPLRRCVDTAQAIASALGDAAITVEANLVECDFGEWEGLTFAEVRKQWPQLLDAWLASPEVAPPGGESFRAVAARTRGVVTRLLAERAGAAVVIISHVTPIKLILRDALAAGDALLHRLFLDPAGISIVDSWLDGGVAVRSINDTAHVAGL